MRRRAAGIVALLLGFGLWWLSLPLTGHSEPWRGPATRYLAALLGGGAICALLAQPRRWSDSWRWPGLIVLGEVAYMLTEPGHWTQWPMAFVALAVYATPAVLGVLLANLVMCCVRRQ
jgi:peptidoglycan/LPS O-acetylase OafA/YrhL